MDHKKADKDLQKEEKMSAENTVNKDNVLPKSDCKEKEEEIKNWKEEYNELYDKYLRLYSEFENFRRRTNKEKLELIDVANESLIVELINVLDDFERAVQINEESDNIKSIREGGQLIFNKFKKVLEDRGLKYIDSIENEFDPELYEALTKIPAPKKKLKGRVVDEIQKGYYLNGKVIRHSKVVVGE
jgi:molecular chaperone GrpE